MNVKTSWVVIVSLAVVLSASILGGAFKYRYSSSDMITVTGLGEQEFVSDLIVWRGDFSRESADLQEAYKALDRDSREIKSYLISKGIKESDIVFSFVNVSQETEPIYGANGNYAGSRFKAYNLSQSFTIESSEVENVELVSREISELIARGITIMSSTPEYFYTKLADLKLELISKATEDANTRAKTIAKKSGAKLGDLKSGRMGVIQITAPNSNEALSWGGSYNSESKNKKASITIKLEYHLN